MREREEEPAFSEYWYDKGVYAGYQMHREKVEALAAACSQGLPGSEAPAPRVRVLDEWTVVGRDGTQRDPHYHSRIETAKDSATWYDAHMVSSAPHRVVRVALVDDANHPATPDSSPRVTDEMVERAVAAYTNTTSALTPQEIEQMDQQIYRVLWCGIKDAITAALAAERGREGPRD